MDTKLLFLLALLPTLISSQIINLRINNAGYETLYIYLNQTGTDAPTYDIVEGHDYVEYKIPPEFEAIFSAYPEECNRCDIPATLVKTKFSQQLLNESYFGIYSIDLSQGFNYRASVGPMFDPICVDVTCTADILAACPEEDQVKNDAGKVVACAPNPSNVEKIQELCPLVTVGEAPNLKECAEYYWEISFNYS